MKIVNVLCTGESLKRYIPTEDLTVGVHKIVLYHRVNHLLFTDRTAGFPSFVIDEIKKGNYDFFHTCIPNQWGGIAAKEVQLHQLAAGRGKPLIDSSDLAYGITSSYTAVVLAYKLGATIIDLYGADFNNHPTFNPKNIETIDRIKRDFKNLNRELINRKVTLRVTKESMLSEFLPLIPQERQYQGNDLIKSI